MHAERVSPTGSFRAYIFWTFRRLVLGKARQGRSELSSGTYRFNICQELIDSIQELKISGIPPRRDTGGRGRKQTASLAELRKTSGDYRRPMQSERPQIVNFENVLPNMQPKKNPPLGSEKSPASVTSQLFEKMTKNDGQSTGINER